MSLFPKKKTTKIPYLYVYNNNKTNNFAELPHFTQINRFNNIIYFTYKPGYTNYQYYH
jgi:hypothetical protein